MILSFLRHTSWVGLAAASAVVACNNTPNPPPDAFLNAYLGNGPACPIQPGRNIVPLGTETADKPTTVANGGTSAEGTAKISCTVHPNNGGFDIDLEAQLTGTAGGSVVIRSTQPGAVKSNGASGGITGSFFSTASGGEPYTDSNCSLSFMYMPNEPVPVSPPVAAGRIWGHVNCNNAISNSGMTVGLPDGGVGMAACNANADFLFEECDQ